MSFIFAATSSFMTGSVTNFVPVSGAVEGIWKFKELLKTAGWAVSASSDGVVSFSTVSDVLTTYSGVLAAGTAKTGSLANKSAWFVLTSPANPSGNGTSKQYWSFQRDSTNNGSNLENWRVKYAANAFDDTTATLTQTPGPPSTHTVSQSILIGGGTDASPTFAAFFRTALNMRWNSGASNAMPYSWYIVCTEFTLVTPVTVLLHDGLLTGSWPDSGSYPSNFDASPYCVYTQYNAGVTDSTVNLASSTVGPKAWFRQGTNFTAQGSGILTLQGMTYQGSNAGNPADAQNMWPNANTVLQSSAELNLEPLLPIPYGRRVTLLGAATGFKGFSHMMRYPATLRTNGTTYNGFLTVGGSRDGIKFGNMAFPWNGTAYLY